MLSLSKNWNSLIKPSKIEYDSNNIKNNSATVVIKPLERGYGVTLGNALRRVLLSSLQGAAITKMKVQGAVHEFSSIAGVKEDLVDIVLNVKKIIIKMNSAESTIYLQAKGPCVVRAGMITTNSDVEILNPDQVICTLSQDTNLNIEFFCAIGKGYVPAISTRDTDLAIGVIPIDALFSPVKKVVYKVEDTRVGQNTDYDKLVMVIETNGSITPEMAVALSARIIQDQLQLFITFEEEEEEKPESNNLIEFNPVLLKKVSHLELSVRSQNCLQNDNIVYIGDLVIKTEIEMLKTQNFGRKSLNEIKEVLAKFNLKFGMEVAGWPPENVEDLARQYDEPY